MVLPHLNMDRCVSSHQLHLPLTLVHCFIRIIIKNSVHLRQVPDDSVDDEIPEREDVQLGSVNGILHLAFRRHVDEVSRISGQDGGHCWIHIPGHAQVSDLGSEVLSEQDVG